MRWIWTLSVFWWLIWLFCGSQEARKAQLENHEPEDEEEDMDMDKDAQDSGQFTFSSFFF